MDPLCVDGSVMEASQDGGIQSATNLELILSQVSALFKERAAWSGSVQLNAIPHLLAQAGNKLKELAAAVDRPHAAAGCSKLRLLGAKACHKEHGRLQSLQDDCQNNKSSLNILLAASTSQDMMRIRLNTKQVSTVIFETARKSTQKHSELGQILLESRAKIDERMTRVEGLVQTQSERLSAREIAQLGPLYRASSAPNPPRRPNLDERTVEPSRSQVQDSIRLRVRPHVEACHPGCPSSRHRPQRSTSPSLLNSILGRHFVNYSGFPAIGPKCDDDDCRGARARQVSVEYWFPASIWSAAIRVQVGVSMNGVPSMSFEALRRISDASQCVSFAQTGNIDGLKYLFRHGLASPRDRKVYQIHKIVLGLLLQKLEQELVLQPEELNAQDAMGHTPLAWAAARGDVQAVAALLTHGADPNVMDIQLSGPLSNAAAQGHTACVELLLESGADPDPLPPRGIKKGSPLSVATRNGKDATLLKRLLDFGADPNSLTAEDQTPLFHATRTDNASFAILLLEHGADINALASTGETPLTTAIKCNSHNILRLFLDRWSEYTVCPRLNGPNLLELAALYGDCETLAILAGAGHLRSAQDRDYTLADFKSLLRQRIDVTGEMLIAFDRLLRVISMAPDPVRDGRGKRDSNLPTCSALWPRAGDDFYAERDNLDDEPDDDFHDALETLDVV